MKNPSPEDLLGYVLGALDADQHDELQKQLDEDPQLEEQLLDVKASLIPLEYLGESKGSRPGLARRTCELVSSIRNESDQQPAPGRMSSRSEPQKSLFAKAPWSMPDFLVAAASIGVLAALLFPILSHSQYQSRIADCGNNLRSLGIALASFSESNDGKFVEIPASGPLAFTGVVGPVLRDARFIDDDDVFSCAGVRRDEPLEIPSRAELTQCAAGPEYDRYRRIASGDYGYSMGHVENGRFYAPRNDGRAYQILLADKPPTVIGGPSDNHGGKGQNCLFGDFRVDFVKGSTCGDDGVFVNDQNIVGPGIGPRDSVIGPSHMSPMDAATQHRVYEVQRLIDY